MKGYLSGPMLGYEELNYPLFAAWAKHLRSLGHEVLVPSENPPPPEGTENPIAYYMRLDLEMVMQSECLWMIPGWMYSLGAKIEAATAIALGIPLLDADTQDPLPITRIHQVVECSHEGWRRPVTATKHFSNELISSVYEICEACGRYPIYDSKFRMDVM